MLEDLNSSTTVSAPPKIDLSAAVIDKPISTSPCCRQCGRALRLDPLGWNLPSIDFMNQAVGLCQMCIIAR